MTTSRSLRRALRVATTSLLIVALAGCGGINTEDTGSLAGDAGGSLRFGYSVPPSRFDPHRGSSSFDNASLFPVYDRLVHLTPEAELVPGLATDWSYAADGLSLDLTIREGVTFHDGEPLDAEAVAANVERALTVEGSTVAAELGAVEAVEVVDDATVRLVLSTPDGSLPGVLSDRAGMMVSPAAFDDPQLDQRPVGAGPYELTSYSPGDRAVFRRFADHWDPEAAGADSLVMVFQPDPTTRMSALRAGELDAALIDAIQVAEAETYDLGLESGPTLAFYHLQLNRSRPELEDVRVRRALNHAVDRDALVEGLLFGNGTATVQPFPEGSAPHVPDLTPEATYPYDPDRARALLAEAGFPDGFSFEVLVPNTDPGLGVALQEMLAEVGVEMRIREADGAQIADLFYAQEEGDAMVAPWGGRADPLQTMALLYGPEGFSNPGRHTTPEVTELLGRARAAIDPDERAAAFEELSAVVVDEALDVPVYFPDSSFSFTDRVTGLQTWQSNKPELRGVAVADAS